MSVNIKSAATPKGFLFSTVEAAVKKPGRKDLAMIYSEKECIAAGMFTTSSVKAAPVKLDMKLIKSGSGRAIVVNSGNANACTGPQGMRDAVETAGLVAGLKGINRNSIYVCSTGVIGTPMPMERIRAAASGLVEGIGKSTMEDVAAAIMTTDTFHKVISVRKKIGGAMVTITGVCKGAGMIRPDMATMLCFITTDASIERMALDTALRQAVARSFNRITIDGDMSTNDTVLVLANGMAGNGMIKLKSESYKIFAGALAEIAYGLSEMIVKDGEGATKLVEVEVRNAKNERDAERGAFAVANSLLVKTAIYGNDANWGRIMAAAGYSNARFNPEKTDIFFNKVHVVKKGVMNNKDREATAEIKSKKLKITVDLQAWNASAKVLTCDLTENYIRINAEYRT